MSDIPARFGGGIFYQETARGRMNRTSKRNLKAIGYDKWSQSIIVEDPETKEKYPIKINLMNEDDVVNILSMMGTAVGTHIDKNDSNLKIRAKKIYSQILSKTLPAMKATGDIQSKLGLAENGGNINVPKNILTRLSRDEFKAMIDHEVQHSHQERMAKRGSGEAVDMAGYQLPGGKITRSIGSAIQRKMGLVNNKLNIGLNATTDWIKDYVNSPAGKKLNTAHDKYLFELEADAAAVRKNGAAVYTRALMHLYGMQASMLRESTINTAKTVAAQNLDKNIKALNDLKTYLHLHDGDIDDATLTKYMNMSGSAVDKISSAAQQIVKQIRQIKSYAAANGIPIKFGTMKEIMSNLNSVEQVVNSFQNPYTTLSANRKEKLLQMDPSKRIQYVDTVYQRCLDARKKSVNIDKQLARLDKILAKTKNEYEARCEFCRAIEKAAPWTKAAVAEFVAMIPELFGIVFSEEYTMEDLADDILMNDAIYEMFNWYEDSFEDMVVDYALDDSDDDDLFEEMVVEYAFDDSDMIEEYCEYEECDWFVQLGDSLFYVSEYHNALFDDPDAHDEAVNEFGILLDSYDDEIVQEASYGPYDEYLKKHGYDPNTNTIEDPNRPGKRVSAGKIGSNKERNRMNKFLRENGYDPKTETILTDIDDKNNPGQKKRVPFTINPHDVTQHYDSAYQTTVDGKVKRYGQMDTDSINMTPKDIQKKPAYSNATYKHEEGHASQMTDKVYDFERDKPLWKSGSEGLRRRDEAKAHIDAMPYEDWKKIKNRDHDLDPVEYDADAYSELHNRYAKGDTMLRSLRKGAQENSRNVDRLNKDRVARGKPDLIEKARDEDEMLFAHQKRGEYAQQQYEKRQKQLDATATKQRQLSKEQLKQQIASGKLTKDQLAKATRKLQRIEQFEKSQRK